ncbi:hypothetical protein ACA910_014042 [Epithemia clementina (nom. ined.)]
MTTSLSTLSSSLFTNRIIVVDHNQGSPHSVVLTSPIDNPVTPLRLGGGGGGDHDDDHGADIKIGSATNKGFSSMMTGVPEMSSRAEKEQQRPAVSPPPPYKEQTLQQQHHFCGETTDHNNDGISESARLVYSPVPDENDNNGDDDYDYHDHDEHPNPWSDLPASQASQRTRNPIRAVVDPIMASHYQKTTNTSSSINDPSSLPTKPFVSLALGDPTTSGNFEPCPIVKDFDSAAAMMNKKGNLQSMIQTTAGYVNALGTETARQVIAQYHSSWELTKLPSCQTQGSLHTNDCGGNHDEYDADQLPFRIPARPIDDSHVIVASGCSGALDLVLRALLDPGTYLLVPNPGFPLYQVIAESMGAHVLPYRLLPDQDWEIDLNHVQTLVQSMAEQEQESSRQQQKHQQRRLIRGIVVNNPSNPTGAVYSWKHLRDLVAVCEVCRLPIVADEIYGDLTYVPTRPFIPLANVAAAMAAKPRSSSTQHHAGGASVPVITCSGIGKQFLVPGWRVGWAIFYDNVHHSLAKVEHGAKQLAQVVLGASHPAQAMAVEILSSQVSSAPSMIQWQMEMRQTLRENAILLQRELAQAPGLEVAKAQGAMYVMVRFDPAQFDFTMPETTTTITAVATLTQSGADSDATTAITAGEQWSRQLLEEENVFVLPGSCFGIPNAFRLVFCTPAQTLKDATQRLVEFCKRHHHRNSFSKRIHEKHD